MELNKLDLKNKESITISAGGSVETSIRIWNIEGILRVEGPINENHGAVIVSIHGIKAVEDTFIK